MDAIIRFLQDTGFYLFSQDGNWRCLIMLGIACVLLYLGIVKKFEPLLLVPIAFGMLITNLPGAKPTAPPSPPRSLWWPRCGAPSGTPGWISPSSATRLPTSAR
ncbi:sodium ion-translocating decarboxylase subunit beta [Dysosmobacter sp.]|uniref:sodium ion-translocating decarboxylase subunit beta n=1 Tax=Dysosmobacter sp. TaxID=2591382 RepID=UPI003AEFA944